LAGLISVQLCAVLARTLSFFQLPRQRRSGVKDDPMSNRFSFLGAAFLASALLSGALPATAQPGGIRIVNGQAYWEGDPGPVQPDSYWTGDAYKYDPHNYNGRYNREPGIYDETVYADHEGKERCVWRKRVINSNWEFQHPFLRVCRK
jgi:hypothetical protein